MTRIVECERFDEMWGAVLAKCEELKQAAPQRRGDSRSVAMVSADGRAVSAIFRMGREDGTYAVHHVTAGHWPRLGEISVGVDTWLDSCDSFWAEQAADRSNAVVIGHEHYRIEADLSRERAALAGFGGALHRIRMLATGEVIESRNLWHQGIIPPSWRDRLPDTAEFLPVPRQAVVKLDSLGGSGAVSHG